MTSSLPSPRSARVRRHVHRGVVEAAALLLDDTFGGAISMRRRAVAVWSPGCTVYRLGGGLLVSFPSARWIDCARAPGLPLVRAGTALSSAPLELDELSALEPPAGSVVVVRGGTPACLSPKESDLEDPATFLDVSVFAAVPVTPLGPEPAPPKVVAAPEDRPARGILGMGEAPREMQDVVAALRRARSGKDPAPVDERDRDRRPGSFLAGVRALFAALLARLFASPPTGHQAESRVLVTVPQGPVGPSFVQRLASRFRHLFATVLVKARLASFVGRRQAEYLGRMLDMFESGDLDQALRHAIPLDDEAGAGSEDVAPALGVPSPRGALAISAGRGPAGPGIFSPPTFFEELRRRYRAAFERLEREGRIDEAAFVLAELLRESAEAVAFLERHGRHQLAAEIAEARGLPPGLVVRQWCLAGKVNRAVLIARRHGCFADALQRLDQRAEGHVLRVLWAETLAEAGDFAAAVTVIWPIPNARQMGALWIDEAIAQGGPAAARMLAKKLSLFPSTFPDVRDRALAVIDQGAPEERRALAESLLDEGGTPSARVLARALARALVRDAAISGEAPLKTLVKRLTEFADDDVMRADLPDWPTVDRLSLARVPETRRLSIALLDAGTTVVHDAALLPDGRLVVALGEAGVRVFSREGRALFDMDQPAHELVISDRGDRALALARRGKACRVARLDLVRRRSEVWCEARLGAVARDFDGATWLVSTGGKLLVIDALDTRFDALSSIELDPPEQIAGIARSASSCGLDTNMGRRRYDLPAWTLRSSRSNQLPPGTWMLPDPSSASPTGSAAHLGAPRGGSPILLRHHAAEGEAMRIRELESSLRASPLCVRVHGGWVACAVGSAAGVVVRLFDERELVSRAEVTLAGAKAAQLRLSDEALVMADDRGRVIAIELAYGGMVRSLRV